MRILVTIFSVLLMSSFSLAQVPNGNAYLGYTYYNTDLSNSGNLNGFEATFEGKLVPFLGIIADFTGHYGSLNFPALCSLCTAQTTVSANAHQYEAMVGPRVSVLAGRFRPFGEFEIGVGHAAANGSDTAISSNSATSYATALGGGLDYRIFGPMAWRLEGDYVRTHFFSTGQNNFRFSAGIAIRF